MVEAFPWDTAPSYLVRDNDGAYGQTFKDRVRAMGIRDRPISPRSPWQNPVAERLIGTRTAFARGSDSAAAPGAAFEHRGERGLAHLQRPFSGNCQAV